MLRVLCYTKQPVSNLLSKFSRWQAASWFWKRTPASELPLVTLVLQKIPQLDLEFKTICESVDTWAMDILHKVQSMSIWCNHDEIYRAATSPSKPLFFLTAGAEILWQARKQRSKQYWWLIINIVYQQTRFNIDDKHIEFLRVHLYQSLSSVDCANKASVHKQKSYHGNFYHCFWYRSQVFGQAFSDTLTQ